MTFKLWLLSIIISTLAPWFLPKINNRRMNKDQHTSDVQQDNRTYQPGKYFDHTMS